MPARIDMIVPKKFRRGAPIPRVLNLHYADLHAEETERIGHIPVTTVLRTIFDLWQSGEIPQETLRSAFAQASDQGKITSRQMLRPERMITPEEVRRTIAEGILLENYPEDPRGHSCLILGCGDGSRPVHVVCAPKQDYLAIITAYIPDSAEWSEDFRVRIRR